MSTEFAIGHRTQDGELRVMPGGYSSKEEAEARFTYLCGPWRDELRHAMEQEDLSQSNWAHRTWEQKQQQRFVLLSREVTPYSILTEERE